MVRAQRHPLVAHQQLALSGLADLDLDELKAIWSEVRIGQCRDPRCQRASAPGVGARRPPPGAAISSGSGRS